MSKDKIKVVDMKDEAIQTDILNTTADSKELGSSSPKSNGSLGDKKVKHSHAKAQEQLDKINTRLDDLYESDRNSLELQQLCGIVEKINHFVHSICISSDPKYALSKTIETILSDKNIKDKELPLVQLLENFYNEKAIIGSYTQDQHESIFQDAVLYTCRNTDGELKSLLGDMYSDYLSNTEEC